MLRVDEGVLVVLEWRATVACHLAVLASQSRGICRPDGRALAPATVLPSVDAVREGGARPPHLRLLAEDPETAHAQGEIFSTLVL